MKNRTAVIIGFVAILAWMVVLSEFAKADGFMGEMPPVVQSKGCE